MGAGVASLAGSPFYGLGDGSVAIDVTFADSRGTTMGHILVDGPIAGAFGSEGDGLNAAAGAIAKYDKSNFSGGPARTLVMGNARAREVQLP